MKELRVTDYLTHIQSAIERIEQYCSHLDRASFYSTPLVQDAVIRNLEIIGEACHNIETHAPDFAAEHDELPLAFAYQMRNALAHGYFQVDMMVV